MRKSNDGRQECNPRIDPIDNMTTNINLLVIEDVEADFKLLQRVLKQQGLDASCERVDTVAALHAALRRPWDVIVSDFHVPGIDFRETLRSIKRHMPHLPVILLSGTIGEERAVELIRDGLDDFVSKDAPARMRRAIESAMRNAHAERELEESRQVVARSERAFRALFESSPTGVIVMDVKHGTIADASARAQRMFGASPRDLRGTDMLDRSHPDDLQAAQAYYARLALGLDAPESVERRYLRMDGSAFVADVVASVVRDDAGHVSQAMVSIVDVTERRALEREVLEISTAEQARIGQEIHDGICQRLTAVGFMVHNLQQTLVRKGVHELADAARDALTQVRQTLKEARALARGASPVHVDAESLPMALRNLAREMEDVFDVPCTLTMEGSVRGLDRMVATHLYRIAQEAVNNAYKHAKASSISIIVSGDDRQVTLRVRDDGVGMPFEEPAWGRMGLSIMRYRARIIHASLTILPVQEGGTEVRCEVAREAPVECLGG